MYSIYEKTKDEIVLTNKALKHIPPHLHEALEIIVVTEGSLALGIGQELYQVDKGDVAIVFPNLIHHYQVFSEGTNRANVIMARDYLFSNYQDRLQDLCPKNPVIKKEKVHSDIVKSLSSLFLTEQDNHVLKQAHMQIILTRIMEQCELVEKNSIKTDDIVYKVVKYVAANFRNNISMEDMARDLGVSKYVLSRVFSGTFHTNYCQYVNGVRLNYACAYLENTKNSITEISMDCGFESQRTFNRVFKKKYRVTPREYRNKFIKN